MHNYEEQKQLIRDAINSIEMGLAKYKPIKDALHLYAQSYYINLKQDHPPVFLSDGYYYLDTSKIRLEFEDIARFNEAIAALLPNSNFTGNALGLDEGLKYLRRVFSIGEAFIKELNEKLAMLDKSEDIALMAEAVSDKDNHKNFLDYVESKKKVMAYHIEYFEKFSEWANLSYRLGLDLEINEDIAKLSEELDSVLRWEEQARDLDLDVIICGIRESFNKDIESLDCMRIELYRLLHIVDFDEDNYKTIETLLEAIKITRSDIEKFDCSKRDLLLFRCFELISNNLTPLLQTVKFKKDNYNTMVSILDAVNRMHNINFD